MVLYLENLVCVQDCPLVGDTKEIIQSGGDSQFVDQSGEYFRTIGGYRNSSHK